MEGLTILKNRGYDSAGIATMSGVPSDGLVSEFEFCITEPFHFMLNVFF